MAAMNPEMLVRIRGRNETAPAFRQVVDDANRAGAAVTRNSGAMVRSTQSAAMQTGNLAAQFNDIAVQLAQPGTSPFLIAIQQGTQIGQVLGPMGAGGAVKSLGAAFLAVLSPVNLFTIGVIAAGGLAVQAMMSMASAGDAAANALADQAAPVDSLKGKISELQAITDAYAKAIRGTAKDQGIATASIIANSEREFEAKKSLLELELKRQRAAMAVAQAEIGKLGEELKRSVSAPSILAMVGLKGGGLSTQSLDSGALEMGGYSDPRVGQFVRAPVQDNLLQATQDLIDQSGISDKLKELRANLTLTELGTNGLEEALKTTFSEGVATSIERVGTAGASAAEKMAGKYKDLVSDMEQRIALSRVEQQTIGMTREELARMRLEQELLNKAIDQHIVLTPKQVAELKALAGMVAAVGEQTAQLQELYDFGKSITQGFFADLKSGLQESGNLWSALGDAGVSALDKIASRALDMAAEGIWDTLFGLGKSVLPGLVSGGGGNGYIPGISGPSLVPSAKGNVFSGPGIAAYSGSVVSSPTLFPFARGVGLMGEAGPEAILPLKRGSDGKLGVSAANGNRRAEVIRLELYDDSGRMAEIADRQIRTASGTIVQLAVAGSRKDFSQRASSGDYRSLGIGSGVKRP